MKIAVIQSDIIWGDIAGNIAAARTMMDREPDADLYVLPEMFTTGFNGNCETPPSEGLAFMQEEAKRRNCAVAGSIALGLEDGMRVNRFYFVTPDTVEYYDKRHLFNYGGEGRQYRAGNKRAIAVWKGVRFLLTVCYDLRFPVWSRNRKDYDVMLCVASWPVQRRYAWDTLLRARAIENQCFVVAANRVGKDPSCIYDGGSVILDPLGKPISACRDGVAETIAGEVDLKTLADLRASFPVLADSDEFSLSRD